MISVDVLDSDHDGAALDEEGGGGFVGSVVTEDVEGIHKAVKYSFLLYYMLKPDHLLTQGLVAIGRHSRISSSSCVFLGYNNSGGRVEELSVIILMLRPPKINSVSIILRLWTAS